MGKRSRRDGQNCFVRIFMGKTGLGERGRLWAVTWSHKIHTFLNTKYLHSARVADAGSFRGGWVSNRPRLSPCGSRDSVVGIATRYGLEGPRIESLWGEIFRTYPDRLRGPPSLLYNGYRVFPEGKGGRDVMLTTNPLLMPRLRKSWAISPLTLWVLLGLLRGSTLLSACI
jgi:hypothetical protein